MNYADLIKKALLLIENNLTEPLDIGEIASESCMSIAVFYRMFFLYTGHSVYEYIRKRRLSEAALRLQTEGKIKITPLAFEFGYESHEAFTRAFKVMFGHTPAAVRRQHIKLVYFGRITMTEEIKLVESRVDIIEITPFTAASSHKIGEFAECRSRDALLSWADSAGIKYRNGETRFFGFDNPEKSHVKRMSEKGYETIMVLNDIQAVNDEIRICQFAGGIYAGTTTTVKEVGDTWRALASWVSRSRYEVGEHQWLEEVIRWDFDNEENTLLRILMPIKK